MQDLRVPVATIPAEIVLTDGRAFSGRIFVPLVASRHGGPTRPDELMNEPPRFFPFLADGSEGPVLVNKAQVLLITVPAWPDEAESAQVVAFPERCVRVECRDRTIEGTILIDLPENQRRMLDYLNLSSTFMTVRAGDRRHLIQKGHVLRVVEVEKG